MKKKIEDPLLLGLDESGRGPVLGPLVVAGVEIFQSNLSELETIGVKDSKELSINTIFKLAKKIKEVCNNVYVVVLSNYQINTMMEHKNLNEIEFDAFSKIISQSSANVVYVDSFSSNARALKLRFLSLYPDKRFYVESKADSKYSVVSAASIIAKAERERYMNRIRKKYLDMYGDIGSGYSSDERTTRFIEEYYKKNKSFPPEVRFKWSTIENIKSKTKQKKLY